MRKDILSQIIQLYDNGQRKQCSQTLSQEKELFNPFQDDHILKQEDDCARPFYMYPKQFQNAKKGILKTVQQPRIKSYSLDKTEQQIQTQRTIFSQNKLNRRSQLKSQMNQVNSINDQQSNNIQAFSGILAKKLKIIHYNHNDKSMKVEQSNKKDSLISKNSKFDENLEQLAIEDYCLERDIQDKSESNNSNSNIIDQKFSEDHQLNIFENILLKQKLQQNQINNQSIDNTPFTKDNEFIDNSNQKEQFSSYNLVQKKDCLVPQQGTIKQVKRLSSRSPSQKYQSREKKESQQFKDCAKKDKKTQLNQNGMLINKNKTEVLINQTQSQKIIKQIQKPINYIEYAMNEMQKQQMEVNLEQATFIPVQIAEKPHQKKQKSKSVNKNKINNEKEFQNDTFQHDLFQEDLNESISNAGSRLLPKNNENSISKDFSSNEHNANSRSLQRNSTEQSILSLKNKQALFKKYLPKLQKQQCKYKFVKIVQKTLFGDESLDTHQTSINSERRTPNQTNTFRDSPAERKKQPQEKENSQILKTSQSSFTLNENAKSLNKLSAICRQKNIFCKTVQNHLQQLEEVTNRLQTQSTFQKVYQFVHNKRIGINHLIELSHILQKQK
ncbi:hypothetical protein ABPG72_011783 [Tetrahymena utriculariae]